MGQAMRMPRVISAAVLIGAFALCGSALAEAKKSVPAKPGANNDSGKAAGAARANAAPIQAIAKAIENWDHDNRAELFRFRAISTCTINCQLNNPAELPVLEKSLRNSISIVLDNIRAIPVIACDDAFARRVKQLFAEKAESRKPLIVTITESKCARDKTFLISGKATVEIKKNAPAKPGAGRSGGH